MKKKYLCLDRGVIFRLSRYGLLCLLYVWRSCILSFLYIRCSGILGLLYIWLCVLLGTINVWAGSFPDSGSDIRCCLLSLRL